MFTITTFNIRCDTDEDGANSFTYRKPFIAEKIASAKPDILCFQEVLPHVGQWLREMLDEYMVLGCGRNADFTGEQMTVALKKERFNLIQMETFWLSPTPYVPGSRYPEQSDCPRCCTEVVVEDKLEHKILRVIDTHLDHIGALPRKLGLQQIMKKVTAAEVLFPEAPVLLCGDLNAEPDTEEILVMKDYPDFVNVTEGIGFTYHGYHPEDPSTHGVIDYIFAKGLTSGNVHRWTDVQNGLYLSDHYPVQAEICY